MIAFTVDKSMWYFCAFFLAGYNILMISFWQSTRYTAKALAVSLSRSVIFLPLLVLILPHIFGGSIIWLCHSLSESVTACVAVILLIKSKKCITNKAVEGKTEGGWQNICISRITTRKL